ncbi:MAG TPA: tetratricopeptide repeat protein [Gemmataceae bacterium]|nr:tetratricopeptide repeat protein [Gemmataceae bacterium]
MAQGADHWQVVSARFDVEAIRRVLRANKEEQQSYSRAFVLKREAKAMSDKRRYREAQPLLQQVLTNFRTLLGEEHPYTATSYDNLAANLNAQGKYKEVEEVDRKALAIRRKALGEEHPETAISYHNLAQNLKAQSKYKEAEEVYRKALAIRRKVLGEEHSYTAISYNNLAFSLKAQGKYKEAEEVDRKALAIRRKVLGEEHSDTAASYYNLAQNLNAQEKYKEAEEVDRKALAIRRKVLGEEHAGTTTSYNNLALNLDAQGKYKEAEEVSRKALVIRRKVLGAEHPDTASSYHNLASSLNAQGKYKEAEESYGEALAIWRKVLGEEHPDTATCYNNLAQNLRAQGKYKEAEEVDRKALVIRRKVLGEEHSYTATSYNNLAVNLNAQGKYKEAEEVNRKALAIWRKVLGEEHSHTAASYNNLALNLRAQGKYKEAEEVNRKALAIRRKVLGEEHPNTTISYNNAAFNLIDQGKYTAAETLLLRATDSFAKARMHVASTGLERAAFTSKHSPLPTLASVQARDGKPADAWQSFEESLARGTLDDLTARILQPQTERDKQAQITARIDRLNQLIQRASVAKPTPEQSKQRDERLTQLRQAFDELAAFTQQLETKYGPIAGQVFPHGQIQKSLPQDAALIAWLDIAGQPKAADPNDEHWAILLRFNGDPIWVRLSGNGDNNAWTDADTQLPDKLRDALQNAGSDWQPLAERLRKQRLDPLAPHLKAVRRLIVLPSTALAGVPLEVIADGYTVSYAHSGTMYAHLLRQSPPTDKGLFALADPVFDPPNVKEKPQPLPPSGVLLTMVSPGSNAATAGLKPNDVLLRYGDTDLDAAKDIKLLPESNDPDKRVPVIVWRNGDKLSRPLFVRPGKLGVVFAKEPAPQAVAEQHRINRLLASRGGDDGNWPRLPGTRIEAASLHRLFDKDAPVQLLLDSDASEQRLNDLAQRGELGKYRYVHLATHGEIDNVFPLRSAVILSRDRLPDDQQRTELLLSGQPIPDGRLSAEDALRRWNLHADLVTLSACQTALGKYERGEGFVGFAQALILCGTRSVCLSLWKVDDVATALLMERFYQNLLGKRDGLKAPMAKAAALAEAKTWLRTLPRDEVVERAASLSEGVSRGKGAAKLPPLEVPAAAKAKPGDCPFAHPHYWAAFILIGHPD